MMKKSIAVEAEKATKIVMKMEKFQIPIFYVQKILCYRQFYQTLQMLTYAASVKRTRKFYNKCMGKGIYFGNSKSDINGYNKDSYTTVYATMNNNAKLFDLVEASKAIGSLIKSETDLMVEYRKN
ncbi:hypothetical protein [Ligilactobacillus hayakitensis]|nr:hypothetical protein [Ligilactobacillus hayakitensis]